MDKKLAEYRARKQRQEMLESFKDKLGSVKNIFRGSKTKPEMESAELDDNEEKVPMIEDYASDEDPDQEIDIEAPLCNTKQLLLYAVYFSIWASLYALFIHFEFGAVFFVCSCLLFIYFNTRTSKKKRNEISAYSVFNPNCESIHGTVKAEDLQRQMTFGGFF